MSGGRVALVTGASRGIGRAIAVSLIEAGYRVAVGYRSGRAEAEAVAAGVDNALPVQLDVSDPASVIGAIDLIERHFGPVAVLVNNAGIARPKAFEELDETDWQEMLSVNLLGAVRCVQSVLPGMREAGFGRIVNISSVGGQWGGVFQVHYAAAKAGLINLTRSLAKLYSREGITCNAVAPGLIGTEMVETEMQDPSAAARIEAIPAGRLGSVAEVAAAVRYLCSDEAAYVTGHTLNVNGGMYFG